MCMPRACDTQRANSRIGRATAPAVQPTAYTDVRTTQARVRKTLREPSPLSYLAITQRLPTTPARDAARHLS